MARRQIFIAMPQAALGSAALIAVAFLTWNLIGSLEHKASAAKAVTPVPYTVKLSSAFRPLNGTPSDGPAAVFTFAVRSDGSRVSVGEIRHPKGPEVQRNVELTDGNRFMSADLWGVKTTWGKRPRSLPATWHRNPARDCLFSLAGGKMSLETESAVAWEAIGGLRTVKVNRGASQSWYALDHGCAMVQSFTSFPEGVSEKKLVALVPGEPDATLFESPSTFREVRPSEYARVVRLQLGQPPCEGACLESIAKDDKRYDEAHGQ